MEHLNDEVAPSKSMFTC